MTDVDEREPGRRWIDYVRLPDLLPAERNPKNHDRTGLARSIGAYGFTEAPLLDERTGRLVAGHGRRHDLLERRRTGEQPPAGIRVDTDGEWLVPVERGWSSQSDAHARAYLAASNKLTANGGWDLAELPGFLDELAADDLLDLTGFTDAELAALLHVDTDDPTTTAGGGGEGLTDADDIPAEDTTAPVTAPGDLWQLGPHRLICGDTTDPAVVARLFDGAAPAIMVHADPPYGMGKESDGIANDNLYRDKLDAFQNAWWQTWLPHLAANASAYVWGNAPDLWRWWYTAPPAGDLMVRNEIVWDKGSAFGMSSEGAHSYPNGTERCLLLMRGQQFLGDQNKDDFFEGYEPLRAHLAAQRDQAGWTTGDVNRITGTHMAGHWMSRSQFAPISRAHYDVLRGAAAGRAFTETYDELFDRMFPEALTSGDAHRRDLASQMREARSPFDNTHDNMTDVWRFGRVNGDDRHGHATPKPVDMVARALATSSRPGDVVAVPFAGTGPEFIAAHRLGQRTVLAAELHPPYVDVVCRRFQAHTGILPTRNGVPHDFTSPDTAKAHP